MHKFGERFDFENQKMKEYINDKKYYDDKISIKTILNATKEMIESLKKIGIEKVNLDDTEEFNEKVFDYEIEHNKIYVLSLLMISFIDLGIIEFEK